MTARITSSGLQIAPALHQFIAQECAPGTGIDPEQFWQALSEFALLFARRPDLDAHGNRLDETPAPAPTPEPAPASEHTAANDSGGGLEPPGLPVAAAPLRTDGAS